MQNELLIAVFAGLGGMLGWGLADFFAKITIDEIGDIASLAWAHIFGTIILSLAVFSKIFFLHNQISIPHDAYTWGVLLFFGILQAAVYYFVYKGFSLGQVSLLNPVFASFSGITSLLSIIFLGEVISGNLLFSLVMIFGGVLMLNLDFQALKNRKISFLQIPGFKEVAIGTLLASFWTLLWGKFINNKDWLAYAFYMYALMTLAIIFLAKFQNKKLSVNKHNMWKFLIFIGFCETIAYLSISLGYSATTHLSIVALLSGAFSLPTILLARIFLKEKVTSIQTIGSIIIIIGIIFLSLL